MRDGYKVFDCDMHVHEPWDLWLNYIDPEFKERCPVGMSKDLNNMNTSFQGKPMGAFLQQAETETATEVEAHVEETARLDIQHDRADKYLQDGMARHFDPVSQLKAMDVEGIDQAVLYPSRGMVVAGVDYEEDALAGAIARAYNNWLADFCSTDSQRMKGVAMILVMDIEEAVRETRRVREEFGFVGIYLHPNPIRGRNWHDSAYDRLWEECQKQNMAVTFHETFKCSLPMAMADRFFGEPDKIWTMAHVACHTVEQMYASLCMIMGGVLEKHPELRIAFLECNASWLPFWLWRMDEHYEHRHSQASQYMTMLPSDYFKRQCYLAIDADEEPAKYSVDWVGPGNFIFSTDYPHPDCKYPYATETFLSMPFSDEAKRKILWDNCMQLYGLG